MSRVCEVTGKRTSAGRMICRRGLPKYKGGVGLKTTGITKRTFKPNTQTRKLWVPELNKFITIKVSSKALRTMTRNGVYNVLVSKGVVAPAKTAKKQEKN